mmetsp:Transcript_8093/g.19123  ORF Transcript_8093/g.19123 Transcript_8093/m.19123 type:complete len:255 (-) Transcript_8093:183-947(-)
MRLRPADFHRPGELKIPLSAKCGQFRFSLCNHHLVLSQAPMLQSRPHTRHRHRSQQQFHPVVVFPSCPPPSEDHPNPCQLPVSLLYPKLHTVPATLRGCLRTHPYSHCLLLLDFQQLPNQWFRLLHPSCLHPSETHSSLLLELAPRSTCRAMHYCRLLLLCPRLRRHLHCLVRRCSRNLVFPISFPPVVPSQFLNQRCAGLKLRSLVANSLFSLFHHRRRPCSQQLLPFALIASLVGLPRQQAACRGHQDRPPS